MSRVVMMLVMLFVVGYSEAAIYQKNGPNGGVSYTDMPSASANVVNPNEVSSTITSPSVVSASTSGIEKTESMTEAAQSTSYQSFSIKSPQDQEVIQNQPYIMVELNVQPQLKAGDEIQMVLDGVNVGSPSAFTQFNIGFVERGTHQLYGVIYHAKTRAMLRKTATITIYVHRNSSITSPAFKR